MIDLRNSISISQLLWKKKHYEYRYPFFLLRWVGNKKAHRANGILNSSLPADVKLNHSGTESVTNNWYSIRGLQLHMWKLTLRRQLVDSCLLFLFEYNKRGGRGEKIIATF